MSAQTFQRFITLVMVIAITVTGLALTPRPAQAASVSATATCSGATFQGNGLAPNHVIEVIASKHPPLTPLGQFPPDLNFRYGNTDANGNFSIYLRYLVPSGIVPSGTEIELMVLDVTPPYPGYGIVLLDEVQTCFSEQQFFNPGDNRVDPRPGDRLAVWCNQPDTLVVYGIDNNSRGFPLTTFSNAAIRVAGSNGLTRNLGSTGTVSVSEDNQNNFWLAWNGGPYGNFAKGFSCKFTCPVSSIQVDESASNGVASGKVFGAPCDSVIEIRNNRGYWVNLKVTPSGGVSIEPVGGADNLYATYGILAPNATVRYKVRFTGLQQTVSALLDVTTSFGRGAQLMNLVQAVIDLISLLAPGVGTSFNLVVQYYPDVVNAFGAMPRLSNAAAALFRRDLATFRTELVAAVEAGEFDILGATLDKLGREGAKEALSKIFKEPGKVFGIVDIIWRSYGNVFALLFRSPAGSILFVAE